MSKILHKCEKCDKNVKTELYKYASSLEKINIGWYCKKCFETLHGVDKLGKFNSINKEEE